MATYFLYYQLLLRAESSLTHHYQHNSRYQSVSQPHVKFSLLSRLSDRQIKQCLIGELDLTIV